MLTRRAKLVAIMPVERPAGFAAEVNMGLAAVPGAMQAAGLTQAQKRIIVHYCIATCSGTYNFSSNQQLYTIRQGCERCVEPCVIEAIHKPVSVTATDTEDLIVARI